VVDANAVPEDLPENSVLPFIRVSVKRHPSISVRLQLIHSTLPQELSFLTIGSLPNLRVSQSCSRGEQPLVKTGDSDKRVTLGLFRQ
jgi:hypothetical protein